MPDQIFGKSGGSDPLGDRLRATFAAERADIERRHLAQPAPARRSRPIMWIPFAAAAAILAIAGFLFIGNRVNDSAVDLGVAGQPSEVDWEVPNPQLPGSEQETPGPTPVGTPAGPPLAQPVPVGPDNMPLSVPHISGDNMCGPQFNPDLQVVWTLTGEPAVAQTAPEATGQKNVSREIPVGQLVTHAGGCTVGTTQLGLQMWYEIQGPQGQGTEWINAANVVTTEAYDAWVTDGTVPPPPFTPDIADGWAVDGPPFPDPLGLPEISAPQLDRCESNLEFPVRFVVGIEADDPDGGLVAHSEPGLNEPVTRILHLDDVVQGTGVCVVGDDGIAWFQLRSDQGLDWASANFLATPIPACLTGEQFGTRSKVADRLIYDIVAGDTLGLIAERFQIPLEELLAANPSLDPQAVRLGQAIWIAGQRAEPEIIVGPLDGLAVVDGDRIGFTPNEWDSYRWYDAGAIQIGQSCATAPVFQPVCAGGPITLMDLDTREPIWQGHGPWPLETTGQPFADNNGALVVEATLVTASGEILRGLIDPGVARVSQGDCLGASSDSFGEAPCVATESEVQVGTAERGSETSDADHVHAVRFGQLTEDAADGVCTRVVIEFGIGTQTGEPHLQAREVPPLTIEKQLDSTRVRLPESMVLTFDDQTRLDVDGVTVLLAKDLNGWPVIDVLYDQPGPVNVWFLDSPARLIVDYLDPGPTPAGLLTGPFGENTILRQPIQSELNGRGLPADEPIVVRGYGRPFETAGAYRIYAVDPDVDGQTFFDGPQTPLIEDFFLTSSWIDGWGMFEVELPVLEPGTYVAVFGETPPSDEFDFIGTGQLFRIADPDDPTAVHPPAALLPDVVIAR